MICRIDKPALKKNVNRTSSYRSPRCLSRKPEELSRLGEREEKRKKDRLFLFLLVSGISAIQDELRIDLLITV